jgi:hypothetical protein
VTGFGISSVESSGSSTSGLVAISAVVWLENLNSRT